MTRNRHIKYLENARRSDAGRRRARAELEARSRWGMRQYTLLFTCGIRWRSYGIWLLARLCRIEHSSGARAGLRKINRSGMAAGIRYIRYIQALELWK